jgi:hypothetical protein
MSTLRVEALEQPDGTAFIFNNKNLLINGGMNVWQRATSQASISSTSTDGYVTTDRWTTYNNSLGTWTQSQSTDVPTAQGFGYSLKMDCTTADASPAASDELVITQKIEAQNLQHLLFGTSSAKSITLSFWVKSNKTGTYIINLVRTDGGARSISKSYTIDTANTWEKKTITFAGDTTNAIANDNGSGIDLNFYLAAGSNYTSGTLATSWESLTNANRAVGQVNLADSTSNEWYMTGCQLEVGSTASGFEFEPFPTILRKCRRYYVRWDRTGPPAVPYVQAVYLGMAQFFSTTQAIILCYIQEPMRGVPDIAYSAVNDFQVIENGGVVETSTAMAVFNDGAHTDEELSFQPMLVLTTSGATNARVGRAFVADSANGFLALDAEL